VNYRTAAGFRAAIDARLKRYAAEHGQPALAHLRKQIVFDRLLARLMAASPDSWALKGGMALEYRFGDRARATRDIDLLFVLPLDMLDEELSRIEEIDLGDFFTLTVKRTFKLDGLIDGSATRLHIQADLDNRKFEEFIVDVGFDVPIELWTDTVYQPGFLAFAGLDSPHVPALAIEIHLAEKLHAYAKDYGPNRTNTRVKDLVDMVLITEAYELSGDRMRIAIDHTFGSRAVQPVPPHLAPPPAAWRIPYATLARTVSIDPDMAVGHAVAASMFDPLLSGMTGNFTWRPDERAWRANSVPDR
jgi:hypothetical protein